MLHSTAVGLGRQQGRELVGILIELGSIRDGQTPFDWLINEPRVGDIPNLKPFLHPNHPEFPLIFRLENPSCPGISLYFKGNYNEPQYFSFPVEGSIG